MNYRMCRAVGCHEKAATRYGVYCNAHRSRLKRHGAVNQDAISKADLRIYEQLVQERIERNKNRAIWTQLKGRWAAVVREAQDVVDRWHKGVPMASWNRIAAFEVVKLSNAVEPEAVIKTVLAIYLMQDQDPRKFKSDKAFNTQMVRRVRGLSSLNAGTWTDHSTGKTKVAYRELSPKAVEAIASQLAAAFGPTGITIAGLEKRDHERKQREMIEHHQALGDIR